MIYESLLDIADGFDTFFFDAFGVFNFGGYVSQSAFDVMADLVARGKSVSIMSNSPRVVQTTAKHYGKQGAIQGIHYQKIFTPGQMVRDLSTTGKLPMPGNKFYTAWRLDPAHDLDSVQTLFRDTPYVQVDELGDADFVFCEFPTDNGTLTTDIGVMEPEIEQLMASKLPVLCPNPDLHFLHGGEFVVAQGLVCKILQERGADVIYYGKPYPEIYQIAMAELGNPDPARALMIGDTLHTDILGATRAGIKSCLTLANGISANDLNNAGLEPTPENLHAAADKIGARIDYIVHKVPRCDL